MNKQIKLALLSTMLFAGTSSLCNNDAPVDVVKPTLLERVGTHLKAHRLPLGVLTAAAVVGLAVYAYQKYNAEEKEQLSV
jgi:hypothetical protein